MSSRVLTPSHVADLAKYFTDVGLSKDDAWYTRDIMWSEATTFGVENLVDLTDDQYMECLQNVH